MSFEKALTFVLNQLDDSNTHPQTKQRGLQLLDEQETNDCALDYQPGDICISYDYWTDEISDDEVDDWLDWFDALYGTIVEYMASQGYELVDDNDGSGGGLYYGAILFRKQ